MNVVEVPSWLVDQFELDSNEPGLRVDQTERFDVPGAFEDSDGDQLQVELECCSGQSDWWATINVFYEGQLLSQSEPFHDLLGKQEFTITDPANDFGEIDITFTVVESIGTDRFDTTEALRLLKGVAQIQMTEETLDITDRGDLAETLDAIIAHARRLVYPRRTKAQRG